MGRQAPRRCTAAPGAAAVGLGAARWVLSAARRWCEQSWLRLPGRASACKERQAGGREHFRQPQTGGRFRSVVCLCCYSVALCMWNGVTRKRLVHERPSLGQLSGDKIWTADRSHVISQYLRRFGIAARLGPRPASHHGHHHLQSLPLLRQGAAAAAPPAAQHPGDTGAGAAEAPTRPPPAAGRPRRRRGRRRLASGAPSGSHRHREHRPAAAADTRGSGPEKGPQPGYHRLCREVFPGVGCAAC